MGESDGIFSSASPLLRHYYICDGRITRGVRPSSKWVTREKVVEHHGGVVCCLQPYLPFKCLLMGMDF